MLPCGTFIGVKAFLFELAQDIKVNLAHGIFNNLFLKQEKVEWLGDELSKDEPGNFLNEIRSFTWLFGYGSESI